MSAAATRTRSAAADFEAGSRSSRTRDAVEVLTPATRATSRRVVTTPASLIGVTAVSSNRGLTSTGSAVIVAIVPVNVPAVNTDTGRDLPAKFPKEEPTMPPPTPTFSNVPLQTRLLYGWRPDLLLQRRPAGHRRAVTLAAVTSALRV